VHQSIVARPRLSRHPSALLCAAPLDVASGAAHHRHKIHVGRVRPHEQPAANDRRKRVNKRCPRLRFPPTRSPATIASPLGPFGFTLFLVAKRSSFLVASTCALAGLPKSGPKQTRGGAPIDIRSAACRLAPHHLPFFTGRHAIDIPTNTTVSPTSISPFAMCVVLYGDLEVGRASRF
jgi:hypothetical protein